MGAADERLDTLLEESRASSMPAAVRRIATAPAPIDAGRPSGSTTENGHRGVRHDHPELWKAGRRQSLWSWEPGPHLPMDFLDPFFMAMIRDTLMPAITDILEGKLAWNHLCPKVLHLSVRFRLGWSAVERLLMVDFNPGFMNRMSLPPLINQFDSQ